ncbi:MAG: carboxymuconolactone decarboxylase family protein [Betaproteobacteria bacterium]|nr:carboxymuconolactone decarboxylase family protein [Betaproteobacteria bacterium]
MELTDHDWQRLISKQTPKLAELTDKVLLGDVWTRPGLSQRDRGLITVAALIALNRAEQLPVYLRRAKVNDLTQGELAELVTHLAFYSGWPTAATAASGMAAGSSSG